MTIETIDGIRVLKLHDRHAGGIAAAADDMMTLVYLWRLLSGGHGLRDTTVANRHYL